MHEHDHSPEQQHDDSEQDHEGHSHGVNRDADRRYLAAALALLLAFMAAEVVVGIMAKSLALISDAGHMLTDVGSIALALFAIRMAARPAQGRFTFGFKRVEILSAQANGQTSMGTAESHDHHHDHGHGLDARCKQEGAPAGIRDSRPAVPGPRRGRGVAFVLKGIPLAMTALSRWPHRDIESRQPMLEG